jgi:hypothetical protein
MRKHPRMDVLKPSTEWCWPEGPTEFRLPGASLDALARALVAAGSEALLVYRGWGYLLQRVDWPPIPEDEDAARAVRRYELTSRYQNQAGLKADDGRSLPGPFVEQVALSREDQGAGLWDVDRTNMRDAIWWLLTKAGAALDAIG